MHKYYHVYYRYSILVQHTCTTYSTCNVLHVQYITTGIIIIVLDMHVESSSRS